MNKDLRAFLKGHQFALEMAGADKIKLRYDDREAVFDYEYEGTLQDPVCPLLDIFETGEQIEKLKYLFDAEYKLVKQMVL